MTAVATALADAGLTADAERIGVEALLTTNWVGVLVTMVSVAIIREGAARLMQRLADWPDV